MKWLLPALSLLALAACSKSGKNSESEQSPLPPPTSLKAEDNNETPAEKPADTQIQPKEATPKPAEITTAPVIKHGNWRYKNPAGQSLPDSQALSIPILPPPPETPLKPAPEITPISTEL